MARPCNAREMGALEAFIDGASLHAVLCALAVIASEKAAHIRENWQDGATAEPWDKAAGYIERCAARVGEEI